MAMLMQDRPSVGELLDAVGSFLHDELLGSIDDPRDVYRLRVAIKALGIAQREVQMGSALHDVERCLLGTLMQDEPGLVDESPIDALNRRLARQIREGRAPAGTAHVLRQLTNAKLKVVSPRIRLDDLQGEGSIS
jgi:hypothetical protein